MEMNILEKGGGNVKLSQLCVVVGSSSLEFTVQETENVFL